MPKNADCISSTCAECGHEEEFVSCGKHGDLFSEVLCCQNCFVCFLHQCDGCDKFLCEQYENGMRTIDFEEEDLLGDGLCKYCSSCYSTLQKNRKKEVRELWTYLCFDCAPEAYTILNHLMDSKNCNDTVKMYLGKVRDALNKSFDMFNVIADIPVQENLTDDEYADELVDALLALCDDMIDKMRRMNELGSKSYDNGDDLCSAAWELNIQVQSDE